MDSGQSAYQEASTARACDLTQNRNGGNSPSALNSENLARDFVPRSIRGETNASRFGARSDRRIVQQSKLRGAEPSGKRLGFQNQRTCYSKGCLLPALADQVQRDVVNSLLISRHSTRSLNTYSLNSYPPAQSEGSGPLRDRP